MINADGDEDPTAQGRELSNLGPAGSEGLSQVWFLVVEDEGHFFRIDFFCSWLCYIMCKFRNMKFNCFIVSKI